MDMSTLLFARGRRHGVNWGGHVHLTFTRGHRHGVDWGGHVHPTFTRGRRHGVDWGKHVHLTLPEDVPVIDADPVSYFPKWSSWNLFTV